MNDRCVALAPPLLDQMTGLCDCCGQPTQNGWLDSQLRVFCGACWHQRTEAMLQAGLHGETAQRLIAFALRAQQLADSLRADPAAGVAWQYAENTALTLEQRVEYEARIAARAVIMKGA